MAPRSVWKAPSLASQPGSLCLFPPLLSTGGTPPRPCLLRLCIWGSTQAHRPLWDAEGGINSKMG